MTSTNVVIVGAGPAGLTAALELQRGGLNNVIVIESADQVGGISKTIVHDGNRIDIGGHRFFSKSEWVMKWWLDILPADFAKAENSALLKYQSVVPSTQKKSIDNGPSQTAQMLIRNRLSRIYFGGNFFDYPLKINSTNLRKLGLKKTFSFGLSYAAAKINPIKPEKSLRDFMVNRFGWKLYSQFFKEYTEKVWGVSCEEISPEWGAQRIKSLSVWKALKHNLRNVLRGKKKEVASETSLIESFFYPRLGPGQMWEAVAAKFVGGGGRLFMQEKVTGIAIDNDRVCRVIVRSRNGSERVIECSHLISTMPIKDLIHISEDHWSNEAKGIASDLEYRDFITVGLLYDINDLRDALRDNWIYIQDPGVLVGRIQIFNNWSPDLVAQPGKVWLGLEYFCNETDELWNLSNESLIDLAKKELRKIKLVKSSEVSSQIVVRVPKAYPGYFGEAYGKFDTLRDEIDNVANLFVIGRNGMHRYNNQDHSMLTARIAAEKILKKSTDKREIWAVNVDDSYHESSDK